MGLPEMLFDRPNIAEKVFDVKEPRRGRDSPLLSREELLLSDIFTEWRGGRGRKDQIV